MTAGLGTRLRPLTERRAKAAVPVNGVPLARRVIDWLAQHDIRDLVLNLHHQPASIAAQVGDGADIGVRVRYSWEQPVVLGSGGGPRHALSLLVDDMRDTCLLVNGDTLTDLESERAARRTLRVRSHRHDGADPQPQTRQVQRGPRERRRMDHRVHPCRFEGNVVPLHRRPGCRSGRRSPRLDDGVPALSVGGVYSR